MATKSTGKKSTAKGATSTTRRTRKPRQPAEGKDPSTGQFTKGNPGGPGGRRPGAGRPRMADKQAMFRELDKPRERLKKGEAPEGETPKPLDPMSLTERAIEVIWETLESGNLELAAAQANKILDRRFGRPAQAIELAGQGIEDLVGTIDKATTAFINKAAKEAQQDAKQQASDSSKG